MLSVQSDAFFMEQALKEAEGAYERGEIPVGAIVVAEQRIVARGSNHTEQLGDVTAHAEMVALTAAASHLNSKYLPQCTLYVTLEPCVMCAGALFWAQIGRLVFGASDDKRGFMRYGKDLLHPRTEVAYGVQEEVCRQLLQRFFRSRR